MENLQKSTYFEQFVQKTLEIVINNTHFVHNFMYFISFAGIGPGARKK